jgi:hypothetical protein
MSLQQFIEYLKINLTGAHDKFKCLHYLETHQGFTPMEREYARGMVDRWISAGMFQGATVSGVVGEKRKGVLHDEAGAKDRKSIGLMP